MVDGTRSLTVRSGRVALDVVEAGNRTAPTVVLVHGYPDTKELWSEVTARLVDRLHVIAYDVRGAGGSTAPARAAEYDLSLLGDDLLAVASRCADGSVHLVGHDWGAIQGWAFATDARFAGVLASLTAIGGPSLDQVSASLRALLREGRALEVLRRLRPSYYIPLLLLPGAPRLLWTVLGRRERWRRILEAREGLTLPPEYPRPTLAHDGACGAKLYRRNLARRGRQPRAISVPVQLIVPAGDRFIPEAHYALAEQFARELRRHTVPGSHWTPLSAPELLAMLIARFVIDVEDSRKESGGRDRNADHAAAPPVASDPQPPA